MNDQPSVLLTNDDGIGTTGIEALRRALSEVADVVVVAPAGDESGASRADSRVFDVQEHEHGYAVEGTPADCVQFGIGWLDTTFDLVVSGCNDGPNLGAHRLTRSGTVAGAIEGAFLGVPGVALSVFDPPEGVREFSSEDYEEAGTVARVLARVIPGGEWPLDYLNVNVPATAQDPRLRLTEPVSDYQVSISETDEGEYHVWDHFWDPLMPDNDAPMSDPVGTDRRAVFEEEVSVTPLTLGQSSPPRSTLESLRDRVNEELGRSA